MMSELGLQDIVTVPDLPGDFEPLDYDDTDGDVHSLGRMPFSDITNMSSSTVQTENTGILCPRAILAKASGAKLSSITIRKGEKRKSVSERETSLSIECREEVVSMKELSDQNQNDAVNFLSPRSKAISTRPNSHLPPVTPTKLGGEHIDPMTPTTNLKMLISAASPEIRNLEKRQQCEKKERLFHAMLAVTSDELLTHQVETQTTKRTISVSPEVNEQENVKENSRKAKSLGLLCERFLEKYQNSDGINQEPLEMSLDVIAKDLNVERRRIYDIINVLESMEMVSRKAKNRYVWHGQRNLTETLRKLKFLGARYNYRDQLAKLKDFRKTRVIGEKGDCSNVPGITERLPKQLNSEEEGKKEKSLGVMSQKFIMLFLQPLENKIISLETAARVLYGELNEDITDNPKFKTKVRRLYDIANILGSLKLIRKVYVQEVRGRKPAFEWIGPDPDIEGFEPANLQSLLTIQEKKSSTFCEGVGGSRRRTKRKQKTGWVRHHSWNALNKVDSTETKAPLSLPSSPEKQPPTPIANSSKFQLELAALYSKYPGQMHHFLTTPPAGSLSSPVTARKLLLPSPSSTSSSQLCSQDIPLPLQSSVPSLMPLNGGYLEGQQALPILEGTPAGGARASKTIFVQRFVPVLTPNTILQMQAQASPTCGTITTAGNHPSCMNILTSSNGLPVGHLPLITATTSESMIGATLYHSSGVAINQRIPTSPITILTPPQGNKKRSPDDGVSRDNEYEAVMKQLKVSHQPGGLVSIKTYPSPPSNQQHSPSSGSPLQSAHHTTSSHQVSNTAVAHLLSAAEKSNGLYDHRISDTPSSVTKKDSKRSSKNINRTKARQIKTNGWPLKEPAPITDTNNQDENSFVEQVRRRLLPIAGTPRTNSSAATSNLERQGETPPSNQETDLSKQKRRLFKACQKQAKKKNKKKQFPSPSPCDLSDNSPVFSWSPMNTPTPVSSLKSSLGSQEFDQMLRNNIGSPLISYLPCHSPCTLPNFTSHAQSGQLTVLPSPTPLPPQTSIVTPISVTIIPSESVSHAVTPYWPLASISGLVQEQGNASLLHPLTAINHAIAIGNGTTNTIHTTAFQVVPHT